MGRRAWSAGRAVGAAGWAVGSLWRRPHLLMPFAVVGLVDLLCLGAVYAAAHEPFKAVLGPIVRAFFGESYLHYPAIYLLMLRVSRHTQVVCMTLLGALMTAAVSCLVAARYRPDRYPWAETQRGLARSYWRFAAVWLVIFGLGFVVFRGTQWVLLGPLGGWLVGWAGEWGARQLAFSIAVLGLIGVEAALSYAIPIAALERASILRSLRRSVVEAGRAWLPTVLIVFVASVASVCVMVLQTQMPRVMLRVTPELGLLFLVFKVAMWVLADFFVTVGVTVLYLDRPQGAPQRAARSVPQAALAPSS